MADLSRTDRLPPVSIRAIYLSKAIALVIVLLVVTPLSRFARDSVPFERLAGVIAAVALFDLALAAWSDRVPYALLVVSTVVDIAGITACIHFGGGVQVVAAPVVYLVVIGLAGTLLSERAAMVTAAGCALAYGGLVWAEHHGLLVHYGLLPRAPHRQVGAVVLVSIGLFVAAWVVLYAVRQVRAVYQAAEELRSESVKALSRDLQNPLGMIERYARMVEQATAAERLDTVRRIQHLAGQALGLVHNVLDAALIAGRAIAPNRVPVDLNRLVAQVVDSCRFDAVEKGITLTSHPAPRPVTVAADPQLLGRAIGNLISNALTHAVDKTTIEVATGSNGNAARVTVCDWQGTSPTGPGLDIVRRIVEAHGGSVTVVNDAGGGCSLTLTVPAGAVGTPVVEAGAVDRAEGGWARRARSMVEHMRADLLPAANVRAIYVVKSSAFSLLILVSWLMKWLHDPAVPAAAATVVVLVALLPTLAVAVRRGEVPVSLLALSVAADVVCVTTGIHIGGGIEMISGPIAYVVVIGVAGLVLSEYAAIPAAVVSALGYAMVAWAEYQGLLAHRSPQPLRPPEFQLIAVTLVDTSLFLATGVVLYAVREVRRAYRRAEEVRNEVVSALSHDLKNPLAVIQGYAQLAEDCEPSALADYVSGMRRSAQQALDLVRNVLDASAIDGQHVIQDRQPRHLDELVRETIELYRFAADAKDIHVRFRAAPATPAIAVDGRQLTRAIGNLVSNAIKYTDRGGAVEVATAVDRDAVTVAVRDTGRGIPAAEQSRLFKKYSRTASARGIEGTGLGLYIVRRIAEAHGGSVRVSSEPGRGSTFTLALPVTTGESQSSQASRA